MFPQFFDEYLLRPCVDAEKIVIYLTPFVLKIDLRVIIYEFDSSSAILSRDFSCHIPDKPQITVLFRKTHYDFVYTSERFQKFQKVLSKFVNFQERLKVLDQVRTTGFNVSSGNNHYFGERTGVDDSDTFTNINSLQTDHSRISRSGEGGGGRNMLIVKTHHNDGEFPTCVSCNTKYSHQESVFNLCVTCLTYEIEQVALKLYIDFLRESKRLYVENAEDAISPLLTNSKLV